MAAPCDFSFAGKAFDIRTMIMNLYTDVEDKKRQLEQTIKVMKQLFKPWPPPGENAERETTETKSENVPGPRDPAPTSAAEIISPDEQAGLDLVDQILNKAQKARDVQKKLEEPKRPRGIMNHRHIKSEHPPDHTVSHDDATPNSNDRIEPKSETIKHGHANMSNLKSKPLKTINSGDSKTHARKTTETVKVDKSVPSSHESSGRSKQNQNMSRGKPIVERPKNGTGKRRVVPAHLSAPFQTNPHLPTKVQTTYRAATAPKPGTRHGTGAPGRGCNSSLINRGSKSALRIPQGASNKQHGSHRAQRNYAASEKDANRNMNNSSEVSDGEEGGDSDNGDIAEHRGHTALETSGPVTNICDTNVDKSVITKNMKDLSPGEQVMDQRKPAHGASETSGHTETGGGTSARQSDKNRFLLARDGALITIPGKLRKFVSQNTKLRQKLFAQTLTKKVNSPAPSQEFPSQLQHTFGVAEDAHVQWLGRQLQQVLSTHDHLHSLLLSIHLDTISDDSCLEEIVRARKLLEYILATFQEMEEMLHSLDCRLLQTTTIHDGSHDNRSPPPHVSSLSTWYDNTRYFPANPGSTITYRSYRELEQYRSLVFKAQLSQAQLDLMESTHKTVLPIIWSLDPTTSEFVQALQCGYAMLSEHPNRVPVIVTDNVDEGCEQ